MKHRANHEGSYRRRDGYWEASIRLGGRRYYVTGRTRRECQEKLLSLLLRHRLGQLSPPSRYTLGEWAHLWLREGEGRWRPTTLRRRRQVLLPLLALLGRVRLSRLEPLHFGAALLELRQRGIGTRSLELCWATLHACLEEAVRRGIIAHNPCARLPRPRHEKAPAQDWGLEDMRRFLHAALADGRPPSLMLALMLLTGLRPGEALGLSWEDVDVRARALRVCRAVVWAGSSWHEDPPESKAGERTLSIPSLALGTISRLPRDSVHLFWRERPPTSKQVSHVMRELCERAGVPRRPAHYLRHAHATLLAAQGLDIKALQRRLGHAQASVTLDVYAHALPEADRRAAELLDGALGPRGPSPASRA